MVRRVRRLNPLTNTRAMLRLNPYAAVLKREAILSGQKRQASRDEILAKKRKVSICITLFYFCFLFMMTCFWSVLLKNNDCIIQKL